MFLQWFSTGEDKDLLDLREVGDEVALDGEAHGDNMVDNGGEFNVALMISLNFHVLQ